MAKDNKGSVCPSARCEDGARLLGIVQRDGTVAFTPEDIRVDADFVEVARQGRKPESRFRFGGPCHRAQCVQWTGERCGVIDAVLGEVVEAGIPLGSVLPDCSIRSVCRWFDQSGPDACTACPLVVTERE
ncbi:MAG: hypothetical protein QOG94_24 [Solirubrobacteraceae bacterium]|jgi:hypothetical protein|nr:hypothetical protein [Solirubrobacteraceae bacterium]